MGDADEKRLLTEAVELIAFANEGGPEEIPKVLDFHDRCRRWLKEARALTSPVDLGGPPPPSAPQTCGTCSGRGVVITMGCMTPKMSRCPACRGTGKAPTEPPKPSTGNAGPPDTEQ